MNVRLRLWVFAAAAAISGASAAGAHELEIDTQAAHAVITALGNPKLSTEEAQRVARLPGNQQTIRKVASFGTLVTEQDFVSELVAVAQGTPPPQKERFAFSRAKKDLPRIAETLAEFERNRMSNSKWILDRVEQFSPPGPPLKLKGWIIAAGGSTGFAFGGPEFYLKINDFVGAPDYLRAIMAHELYHAVQGAALTAVHKNHDFDIDKLKTMKTKAERDSYSVRGILTELLNEGIATYVGDPMLSNEDVKLASQERDRIRSVLRMPRRMTTLLDMALVSLTDHKPLPPDDVYSVGFYADQPLYYLGYAMAKTIAEKKGAARLGQLALGDGCGFAQEFLQLSASESDGLKLGERGTEIIKTVCASPPTP